MKIQIFLCNLVTAGRETTNWQNKSKISRSDTFSVQSCRSRNERVKKGIELWQGEAW